jgi:hypothetical protein
MQQESSESIQQHIQPSTSSAPSSTAQHGPLPQRDQRALERVHSTGSRSSSPQSVINARHDEALDGLDTDQLDEKLRGLNVQPRDGARQPVPGQRVFD